MPVENPVAHQRGLALILAAIVLLVVGFVIAPALGTAGSWVVVVLSVAAVAALARWTYNLLDKPRRS